MIRIYINNINSNPIMDTICQLVYATGYGTLNLDGYDI